MNVYIPSRSRAGAAPTISNLLAEGIRPTVVVHTTEQQTYADAYPKALLLSTPLKGIGKVRQFILEKARQRDEEHIWILDDDITGMFVRQPDRKFLKTAMPTGLLMMELDARRFEKVALAGPLVRQFAWAAPDRKLNRRVGIAVLLRTDGPWDYWPYFHEDTDMILQVREAGYQTLGWGRWAIESSSMGKTAGGCSEDYSHGAAETGGQKLVERWKERLPGVVATTINPRGQMVSKINWSKLDALVDK